MLTAAASRKLRVYLVGTMTSDEINHVSETLQLKIPNLHIVGVHEGRDMSVEAGKVTAEWTGRLADQIEASDADLILVGMGFPLQEEVISVLATKLNHGVLIGEGGTFDYEQFGGTRTKAPAFMQKIGLEWLWRLILEPKRIKRQLAVPRFIWRIWRSR
jgi:N-acetylglucosaminyldiphosphoundecaprenol N-acetyl-beta-D-mannosaminyltransferase